MIHFSRHKHCLPEDSVPRAEWIHQCCASPCKFFLSKSVFPCHNLPENYKSLSMEWFYLYTSMFMPSLILLCHIKSTDGLHMPKILLCILRYLSPFNCDHLQSYKKKTAFIATHWPLEDTVVDFWRLIRDYEVCHIILLEELTPTVSSGCI